MDCTGSCSGSGCVLPAAKSCALSQAPGLRPCEPKVASSPCFRFGSGDFLFCSRRKMGLRLAGPAARTTLKAKAYYFIIYLNPPAAHSGNPAAAPPPLDRGSEPIAAPSSTGCGRCRCPCSASAVSAAGSGSVCLPPACGRAPAGALKRKLLLLDAGSLQPHQPRSENPAHAAG